MTKFLLVGINAKYIHSNPGIFSLRSYALKELESMRCDYEERIDVEGPNIMIDIAEYTINMRTEQIISDIYKRHPDVIGFSTYIWNVETVKKLITDIMKVLPNTHIYLGGPEVSFNPAEYLDEYEDVKAVMIGEGEETFSELVGKYAEAFEITDETLSSVKGLWLRTGYTGDRNLLSLDKIDLFYEEAEDSDFSNRIIYYESSRGCPFRCSYCLSSVDKTTRFRSVSLVKSDLMFFLDRKVSQVKFIDRTFNANHDRTMEIWNFINENDNGVTNFHFEIAADLLKDDEIELVGKMRPGLIQLEIGVQTTNSDTLKAINRPTDIDYIRNVVGRIRQYNNAHVHLDLIAGLPYEDMESFRKSFNEVFSMNPNQLQLGFLKVLKGSPIEKEAKKYGIRYSEYAPYEVMSTDWISYEDVLKLKNIEEMVETFYNSAQFTVSLPELLKLFETPFDMFAYMGDYYEKNDMFVKLPARSKRYEILLDIMNCALSETVENDKQKCVGEITGKDNAEYTDKSNIADGTRLEAAIEKFRDCLTLDYYLREKPKSRPDFVKRIPEVRFDYDRRDPLTGNYYIKG